MTNKQEKLDFINTIIETTKNEIISKIHSMPENWNGVELREYVKEKFSEASYMKMDKKRSEDYNNDVIVNNL